MILHVEEARYVRDHIIWLRFNDGNCGEVDLSGELHGEVFEPLKDVAFFKQFSIHPEFHTITWPNGADFAPEFLYDNTHTLFGATKKLAYKKTFYLPPSGNWEVAGSLSDIFFTTSRTLIEGVVYGDYREGVEGIAATYLFRHYLEIRLKHALLHARWLKTSSKNEEAELVEPIRKIHYIDQLWAELVEACKTRIPSETWSNWDVGFVSEVIQEFHAIDPQGDSLRYGNIKKFGSNTNVSYDPRDVLRYSSEHVILHDRNIGIDFRSLLSNMNHVHDVLEAIDGYLRETYGQNKEWESILNSY